MYSAVELYLPSSKMYNFRFIRNIQVVVSLVVKTNILEEYSASPLRIIVTTTVIMSRIKILCFSSNGSL